MYPSLNFALTLLGSMLSDVGSIHELSSTIKNKKRQNPTPPTPKKKKNKNKCVILFAEENQENILTYQPQFISKETTV